MTRSRSVRSSRGGDRFDSSDSLTMITLSPGAAEGRGRSSVCKTQRSRRRRGGSSEGFKGVVRPPKLVFHTLCTYPCVIGGSGDIVFFFCPPPPQRVRKTNSILPVRRHRPLQVNQMQECTTATRSIVVNTTQNKQGACGEKSREWLLQVSKMMFSN